MTRGTAEAGESQEPTAPGLPWVFCTGSNERAMAQVYRLDRTCRRRLTIPRCPGAQMCLIALEPEAAYDLSGGTASMEGPAVTGSAIRVCDRRLEWTVETRVDSMHLFLFAFSVDVLIHACGAPIQRATATADERSGARAERILVELAHAIHSLPVPCEANAELHLLTAFLLELGQAYPRFANDHAAATEQLAPWQVRRATEFIRERLAGKASVSEIAGTCGLSTSYFSRLFKNTTGMTTHQWIVEHRIERARHLLLSTSMPHVDIAYACGFADQTHFTRVFSRKMKTSPLVWRRFNRCGVARELMPSGAQGTNRGFKQNPRIQQAVVDCVS